MLCQSSRSHSHFNTVKIVKWPQDRQTTQLPAKALFYFPEEDTTGIAPTHVILEKHTVTAGETVTVNWQGEHVPAMIIKLGGKYTEYSFTIYFSFVDHHDVLHQDLSRSARIMAVKENTNESCDKENQQPSKKACSVS